MIITAERLYRHLPAVYRIRDQQQGETLKALIAVIAEQAGLLEEDIGDLYENWFIETCDEWVVPYIGDLLGVRGLHSIGAGPAFSQRGRVANALRYRRRKGTATMLEQLARDATGWNTRAVEFFELLATTQHFNHVRLHNHRTPDLRRTDALELLESPFDTIAHTADVRRIATGRGRHNIPNIGIFLWRLQSYFVQRAVAHAASMPGDGRFTFHPIGFSAPLFNRPQTETEITHLAEEINVPGLLRRRPLYDELDARRQSLVDGRTPEQRYFGAQPVLQIFVQGTSNDPYVELPPEEILICQLTEPAVAVPGVWLRPPTSKLYQPSAGGAKQPRAIKVAVDPALGRIAFPTGVIPNSVKVSYACGFSGDVGGGPYNRRDSIDANFMRKVNWQVGVSREIAPVAATMFATLAEAVTEWNSQPAPSFGVIAVLDSHTYEENLTGVNRIKIPEGSHLLIVAGGWPETPVPGQPGQKQRVDGRVDADERRPHLRGNISVTGTASGSSQTPGDLTINGLWIEGKLSVLAGNLGRLELAHSTFVPDRGGVEVATKNERLRIVLTRAISGPIALDAEIQELRIEESIVDAAGSGDAIVARRTAVEVQKSTLFGGVAVLSLEAGNAIFTEKVEAERRQVGCVRFSYVPVGSKTPRRFRCQPDLALQDAKAAEQANIIARLVPSFTAATYGHHGYGQLGASCAEEIRRGAEDGSEMGVFSFLKQPQREINLRASLDEYLRLGLEAGILYVT